MSDFKPSEYQQAIFDWIQSGSGSAIIEAVAGSGKTKTIVKALDLIPSSERAIFLAFNKSIAEELKSQMPANARATTFHAAGLRAWRQSRFNCLVDDHKVFNLTKDSLTPYEMGTFGMFVKDLVGFAKQRGILAIIPDTADAWQGIIDHFDLQMNGGDYPIDEEEIQQEAIKAARYILQKSNEQSDKIVDFNDMLYMPLLEHLRLEQYPFVFIDEGQDTNSTRRELAKKMAAPGGRVVVVGDSHQAIYGFTGADSDALELLQRDFDARIFPLSVCYRSARLIVAEAKKFVPAIEPKEDAPEGIVAQTSFADCEPGINDAILCRNTAPLVDLAYQFIGNGKGCKILGRDIGIGLTKLVKQMRVNNINQLSSALDEYCHQEVDRFMSQGKEARAQSVIDRVECLQTIIGRLSDRTIHGLCQEINKLFVDGGGKLLTLSTIHKFKGLERDNIYVYRPDLMPSKWANQEWQLRQEVNLQYVAITRARQSLYYVVDASSLERRGF